MNVPTHSAARSRRRALLSLAAACAALALSAPASSLAAQSGLIPGDWPNVFISPFGQPFRAKDGDPYPIGDWFKQADKNADGKIDHEEFVADAANFFKQLDLNHDGVISPYEISNYETVICPEVVGVKADVSYAPVGSGARLWLAQYSSKGPSSFGRGPTDPGAQAGAAPYSFFDQPEPVAAADIRFRGVISREDFLQLANRHWEALILDGPAYLTLATLPKTPIQVEQEHQHRHKRR